VAYFSSLTVKRLTDSFEFCWPNDKVIYFQVIITLYFIHWQNGRFWATAFFTRFFQVCLFHCESDTLVLTFLDFVTIIFYRISSSALCSTPNPLCMSPSDTVAQLHPQAPGSLFVSFYNLQGYSGGTLTRFDVDNIKIRKTICMYLVWALILVLCPQLCFVVHTAKQLPIKIVIWQWLKHIEETIQLWKQFRHGKQSDNY
jgi:hypothetical protein